MEESSALATKHKGQAASDLVLMAVSTERGALFQNGKPWKFSGLPGNTDF